MPVATNLHLGHAGEAYPDAFYVRTGEHSFISTLRAQGAWQPGEQHLAPASGLVLAEVERRLPGDKLVSRVSFDVLGVIHSGEFTIDVAVVRPGKTIELVEANMAIAIDGEIFQDALGAELQADSEIVLIPKISGG